MTARAERLAVLLAQAEVDLLLVSDQVNLRYLTGYTGDNGLALVGPSTRTFLTDFRYVEQAAEEVDPSFERRQASLDLLHAVEDALADGPLRLGFEDASLSVRTHTRLRELLPARVELVAAGSLVERLRAVKEPEEIARIRAAAALADEAFEQVLGDGLVGRTERDLAMALERELRVRGARRASFETIVAAGPHGALPHAQPRDVLVGAVQLVVIDWGAELDGYCSDCTRTIATGELGDDAVRVYDLVLDAQRKGVEAIASGRSGRDVDGVARRVIEAGGHGEHFGHGLGHGVGIAVHEAPRLSQRSDDDLRAGNVVTVEPGIYLPGQFGVRIEDLVALTDGGCEILSSIPKELIVVE